MAVIAAVQVRVDASSAEKSLTRLQGTANKLKGNFQGINQSTAKTQGAFGRLQTAGASLQGVLVGLGAGAAVKGFAQAGIEAQRTSKRLQLLGDGYGETAKLQEIAASAADKFSLGQTDAASAVADLYGRLRPMDVSLKEIETVFSGVNVAAKQMNLSTADTEGVMLQLSQALGSGKLQGDEFRSVMERLPKIGQAVAKSMGKNVSELKELSSQGALTTQEIIKALQDVAKEEFPPPDAATKFNKAMKDLSTSIGSLLLPVLTPAIEAVTSIVTAFTSLPEPVKAAVVGFTAVAGAFAIISPLLPVIAAGLAAIVAVITGPVGIVAAIVGVTAGFFAMKGATEEVKQPVDEVNSKINETKTAIDQAVLAKQRMIESAKTHIGFLEKEKTTIAQQEAAFENSLRVTDARLNAESAINEMQNQGLQVAYEQAGSAAERLKIAQEIFRNEMEGAKIVYQQTLNSIDAERQRLEFRMQAAELEARMIQAKGELAAAEADSAEKAALILDKTSKAVEVQKQTVQMLGGQIAAQDKIAGHQIRAAEAQLESSRMTAEQNLNQRLVSDEINMSEKNASALSGRLGESAMQSRDLQQGIASSSTGASTLATGIGQVAQNASQSASNFIRVADSATSAANAINQAAAAQRSLNAARASQAQAQAQAQASAATTTTTTTTQAAAAGAYWGGGFQAFAKGGMVKGPTLGLIGEGGEPEYIIPQSKAAGFATNYLSGQRGISAVPGFADGGYATPNVNIQTGPVTQMGGTDYVTKEDMVRAVKVGVQTTLKVLKNDLSLRAGIGIA